MAILFSATSQNFTASGWKVVDATSYLNSEAGTSNTTTSNVSSTVFATSAITVEGILVRIKSTTGVGTLTVSLWNNNTGTQVAAVTCNTSDIAQKDANSSGGWVYFKFGSPVTLAVANHSVRILSSVANTVTYYRNTTSPNISRGLVTSTTASAAASDTIIIGGNITGAGSTTVNTITFDNTTATSWGSIEICSYGKMTGENSASKNYNLTISDGGFLRVTHNGIVELSTTSSRLPSSSTFVITTTCATAANNGIDVRSFGTFRAYGLNKTRKCKIASQASSWQNTISTDVSTSWLNNDNIVITGTTLYTQAEQKVLNGNASGTTLTLTSNLSNTHEKTGVIIADVINLTSNFQIFGTSTTLVGYMNVESKAIIDIDNIEFQYYGRNSSTSAGITLNTSVGTYSGSVNIKNCSIWNIGASGFGVYNYNQPGGSTIDGGVTIDGLVGYSTIASYLVYLQSSVGTSNLSTLTNCVAVGFTGVGFYLSLGRWTFTNNISCCVVGFDFTYYLTGTYDSLLAYGCSSIGIRLQSQNMSLNNSTSYRSVIGLALGISANNPYPTNLSLDTITLFGNTSYNINFNGFSGGDIKLTNVSCQGGTTTVANYGIGLPQSNMYGIVFDRCSFGTVTQHALGDLYNTKTLAAINDNLYACDITFINCTFGSSTTFVGQNLLNRYSKIKCQRFNTAGNHITYKKTGTLSNDSTIYDSSSVSQRMTPNDASNKLSGSSFQIAVESGNTATFSIKVRKSVVGDGTAYNGSQPRLILKSNSSAGSTYNSDIVCATASAAAGTWETLSYTLPISVSDSVGMEFYVDCDGTTGWINIDSIIVS